MSLTRLPGALVAVGRSRSRLLVLLCGVLLLTLALAAPHPYNQIPFLLHNRLTAPLSRGGISRLALLMPALAALIILCAERPTLESVFGVGAALLLLLPARMIEHRYTLIPLVLLQLYRPLAAPAIERTIAASWAAASTVLVVGIARGWFFL
jgi:hypothetical protein